MKAYSALLLLFVVALVVALCADECTGQGRRPPQPKPEPKGPERNIPGWTEAPGSIPEDKEEARKATVFEHFTAVAECKMDKPFMIYFYWPDEGKMEKTSAACAIFEKALAEASQFQDACSEFGCYKCNAKDLDKKLVSKHGVKIPCILVFNALGKKVHTITKISKSSDKSLAKKLASIKAASDKAVEKVREKEESKDE
jgi:hypothetical protein